MSLKYDDGQYGVVERIELAALQASKTQTGDETLLKRWYPPRGITLKKWGVRHIATQGGTETTLTLSKNTTAVSTIVCSTDSAAWTIGSKSVTSTIPAGDYLSISSAGTVATGSVVCFIDYYRTYGTAWSK
ncbi:MAG: hypothetical protein ACYTEQ_01525 [Planctomycetota bacterium]|jgi:hypothetical protein